MPKDAATPKDKDTNKKSVKRASEKLATPDEPSKMIDIFFFW